MIYYGTYTSMCEWLEISSSTENISKLKKAVEELAKDEIIEIEYKSKRKFALFITPKGRKDKRCIEIKKEWIEAIKHSNKNGKVKKNWDTMLKALVVILNRIEETKVVTNDIASGIIITMKELAEEINKCEATAGKVVKELKECNFYDGFQINKEAIYKVETKENGKNYIRGYGTQIEAVYDWEEQKQ